MAATRSIDRLDDGPVELLNGAPPDILGLASAGSSLGNAIETLARLPIRHAIHLLGPRAGRCSRPVDRTLCPVNRTLCPVNRTLGKCPCQQVYA